MFGGDLVVNWRGQDVLEWIWSVPGVVCEDPRVDFRGCRVDFGGSKGMQCRRGCWVVRGIRGFQD